MYFIKKRVIMSPRKLKMQPTIHFEKRKRIDRQLFGVPIIRECQPTKFVPIIKSHPVYLRPLS
jgi:hypothetical protein